MKKESYAIESAPTKKKGPWKILIIILIVLLVIAVIVALAYISYNYFIQPIEPNVTIPNQTYVNDTTPVNDSRINDTSKPIVPCGDGKCNGTENYNNCPKDCKKPTGPGPGPAPCTPNCTNKQCGGDGCGGSCGTCTSGICNSTGNCVELINCTIDSNCSYLTAVCGTGLCNQTIKQCYVAYNLSTTLCRNNLSECDAVETCSGNSVSCQDDLNKSNGVSCSIGACQNGKCSASGGPFCGNTGCEGTENCLNCPQDCPCSIAEYCDVGTCKASAYFEANYYVDYLIDDCNNYNVSTRTCGNGDRQAYNTVQEGLNFVQAGQTLAIRGGTYREAIVLKNSGTETQRVIIRSYPNEEAIIDGSKVVTGWKKCSSQQECLGNQNWQNIYYASVPQSVDAFGNPMQGLEFTFTSQYPNMPDRFYKDDIGHYLTVPPQDVANHSIIDSRLAGLGGSTLVGSYIGIWIFPNGVVYKKILNYIPSENKILFEEVNTSVGPCVYQDRNTNYSILNHYNSLIFDSEGEFYVNETVVSGNKKIYLWPLHGVNLETSGEISINDKSELLTFGIQNFTTIDGLIFQKSKGNLMFTAWHGGNYNNILRNNELRFNDGGSSYSNGIYLYGDTYNFLAENNYMHDNRGGYRGFTGGGFNTTIRNNYIKKQSGDAFFLACTGCYILNNTITGGLGVHYGGIKAYAGNKNLLIADNKIINNNEPVVYQLMENVTVYNNYIIYNNSGEEPCLVNQWRPNTGKILIFNNLLIGGRICIVGADEVKVFNNIAGNIGGCVSPSCTKGRNAFISSRPQLYNTDSNDITGKEGTVLDRTLIFKNSPVTSSFNVHFWEMVGDGSYINAAKVFFADVYKYLPLENNYLISAQDNVPRQVTRKEAGYHYAGLISTKVEFAPAIAELDNSLISVWKDTSNLNIDYHLKQGSIAVDNGTDMSSVITDLQQYFPAYNFYKDLEGNLRPTDGDNNGSAEWDVGPYEYQPASIPSQPLYSSSSSKQGFWSWFKSFFS